MKKKLVILFLILAPILYIFSIYLYGIGKVNSLAFLVVTSFLVALASNLYKNEVKKDKKTTFDVNKPELKKKNKSDN